MQGKENQMQLGSQRAQPGRAEHEQQRVRLPQAKGAMYHSRREPSQLQVQAC